MTRKQAAKTIAFLALTLALLVMLTYMLRTNGAVKDRFAGFYAEKKNSIDVIMIGSSPVFPYYSAPQMYGEGRKRSNISSRISSCLRSVCILAASGI